MPRLSLWVLVPCVLVLGSDILSPNDEDASSSQLWKYCQKSEFLSAVITSYVMIVVTELGDKTFFIAALLAMKRGACVTFSGAAAALAVMTLIAAFVGRLLPAILSPTYTEIASILLFVFFGLRLLWEGFHMDSGQESEELDKVEKNLASTKKIDDHGGGDDLEEPSVKVEHKSWLTPSLRLPLTYLSAAFIEAFTLTFAAEWGDRSQIATVALGASKNVYGVNLGAIFGHFCCTGLAVIGGKVLATRISERVVTLVGGTIFLFFALAGYLWEVRQLLHSTVQ
eukprot:Gregarina_sp_Poly_1__5622@NODE_2968_length_1493_cov_89_485975_g1873_i0_p1_GENE_NODE_2968_length_1493_cov_89_485975_g1873_i0NODE_2968_length_1493_cov_89_485975_g1873_i0_p1_ORF_typecomplete_len283_score45_83UPF0016/PF01169_19/2_5e18UPF0016/PF01169_19/4_8e27Mntp/PF02659_15/4_6e08LysE/PF01810_18/0_057TerC/PF03741_16/22TerC/PF03741_16/0_25SLATT_fungal/PF18142_1/15SLATT_fungal/PF18142_1/3_8e03SLATT_fungal/PF18142_1/1_5e03SLATT_fungal/PF18142_1/1e02_NODE_2968_length_1493_cov_89_485975_g1873_i05651413